MKRLVMITIGTTLLAGVAVGEDPASSNDGQTTVPATIEGGTQVLKDGGREIGEGFRGIGRGVKDTVKGERSKEDFEEAGKIGTGVKDLGRGTAGVALGTGRRVKQGFKGEGADDANDE